jgi:hypothetical protein
MFFAVPLGHSPISRSTSCSLAENTIEGREQGCLVRPLGNPAVEPGETGKGRIGGTADRKRRHPRAARHYSSRHSELCKNRGRSRREE